MQTKTQRTTGIAIMAAIIVLLQVFAIAVNFVTPGTIPVALVLPPIIIGQISLRQPFSTASPRAVRMS